MEHLCIKNKTQVKAWYVGIETGGEQSQKTCPLLDESFLGNFDEKQQINSKNIMF
ncbi:hypothetical protein DES34_108233 [Brevibacillus brevis]|nr:hypothetical protein DES34_108233 [Brevibacillus brevis]TQK74306.1 hypothetical protein FB479_102949 [Brevibacillus sp. AG162]VEF91063.1 Uncharacterised protein [Brevibacillus brevis]